MQSAASSGHADIRAFSGQFRALLSTRGVDARDNTATTGGGVPIYWLDGAKVADNYADFYDGSWDTRAPRDRNGNTVTTAGRTTLTGSNADGSGEFNLWIGGAGNDNVRIGRLDRGAGNEIHSLEVSHRNNFHAQYALSPVLTVAVPDTALSALTLNDMISVGALPLTPAFDATITAYTADVTTDIASLTLTPGVRNPNAIATVGATFNGVTTVSPVVVASGIASDAIPLQMGTNIIQVVVTATADNLTFSTTYTFTVNRRVIEPAGRRLLAGSSGLVPPGLGVGAPFRLLFVGNLARFRSQGQNASLSHYNDLVIAAAADGHADIRAFSDQFRALASTATVDARNNTATIESNGDVPIYWLGGDKVADHYADFYDRSWDSRAARDRLGNTVTVAGLTILTGSNADGVGPPIGRLGDSMGFGNVTTGLRVGRLDQGEGAEIDSGVVTDTGFRPLYSLSPVLTLEAAGPQPPVVWYPIRDQSASVRVPFHYTFPANTFYDINQDVLTYSATGLPDWLSFDAAAHSVSGTPPPAAFGQPPASITITAADGDPATADVSDTFTLTVNAGPPAAPANVRALAGDGSITVSWDAVTDTGGYPVQEYQARISVPHPTTPNQSSTLLMTSGDPAVTSVTFNNLTNGTAYFNIRVTVLTGPSSSDSRFAVETSLGSSYILTPISATLDPQAFITTWRTNVNNETITIPTNSDYTYDYTVDWGDGNIDSNVTGDIMHSYLTSGLHLVSITGTFPHIYFNVSGDRDKIRSVKRWGPTVWSSMERSFAGCTDLTIEGDAGLPDLSEVTSMRGMLEGTSDFDSSIGHWDVSTVTDMSSLFHYARSFNADISEWDVSNVTDMSVMFQSTLLFNADISEWDVSAVTDTNAMFNGARAFNADISGWNVSGVTDMSNMFNGAFAFNSDLSRWDVSAVTNMSDMFNGALVFNQNLGAWDVGTVTTAENMLVDATLSTANYDALLRGWSEVTDGEGALDENVPFHAGNSQFCDSVAKQQLTTAPNSWNITDDGGFAANCPLLPGAFVTTWAVAAGQRLTIPTNSAVGAYDYAVDWGDGTASTAQSGDAGHTYTNAGDYTVTITGDFPQLYINGGAAKSVIRRVQQWGDQKWRSMENSFAEVENFVIAPNAGKPDLSLGPSLHFMFRGASTSSPIGHWDVSMVTDMSQMFQNARRFNEDLSDWDVSSVTDFSRMFNGVPTFDQDLGDWDVSSATDLTDMFHAVTLSRENYDSLLAGWSAIDADEDDLQPGRSFSAGNSIYCNQSAHDVLTNPPNSWTIADAGAETSGNCRLRFAAGVSVADQAYTAGAAITLALPAATGGGVPLIYHLAPLPDGLTLYDTDAAPDTAALLIGVPSAAMPATAVTYTATDANGATATLTFSLAVAARPAFAADAIPASDPAYTATANSVNTLTLPAATGGAGILRYRLTPAASLPAGMAFDPTMRAIVGTPTAETTATVLTYTVTDANFVTATLTFSLAVATELTFGVVNGEPVRAVIPNQFYSVTQNVVLTLPTATGGVAPLTYTLTRLNGEPVLAPGLIFFPTGPIIAGAPDVPFGNDPGAHLRYTVTDANGASVMRDFFMRVIAAPSFDGVSIPDQFYTAGVAIPPLTLPDAASEGTLVYDLQPAAANGLSVDLENRILTGTPDTVTDAVTYTYTAFDDNNVSATLTFTVTVNPPLSFDFGTIAAPEASYDFFINHPITPIILPPTTGTAQLTRTLMPIPDGLIFDVATRTLFGTPTMAPAITTLTYTVTDSNPQNSQSVSLTFSVTVAQGGITWSGGFVETAANDGSVSGSLVATLTGDTFDDPLVENDYDRLRVPDGLTFQVTRTSASVATLTLIGKADSHTDADDEGRVFIGWIDAAFTNLPADNIVNSLFGRGMVDFNDPGPPVFTAAITDKTYPPNVAITPLTLPIATDGFAPLSYALLPAASLPPGLTFDAENRSIFGMPTRATTATLFYTVTDAGTPPSTAALAFSVTVESPGVPRITGTARPGFTLSADRSGLADADGLPTDAAAYAWQWQQGPANGDDSGYTNIPAATASTLLLTTAHLGRRIRLVVSYTDNGGNPEQATSAATAVVSADPPGLTLTPASLDVTEGATATYTLALATQPGESVLVAVIDENPDVTTSPAILTFTPENWNTPQPITVTARHDADTVDDTATLTHTAAAGGYNAVTATLAVTVHDEDAALVLTPASLTLTENTTATYSVALAALPAESVTVTVGSDNPDVTAATTLGATPVTLTFTTENWDTPQPVTVTAAQDADAAPDTASLTHTASAAGGNYNGISAALSVIVTETETAGLVLTPPTPSVVLDEGAATYTYTAVLTSPPTTTVTVTTNSNNPDVTTLPPVLTFTAANWLLEQSVTIAVAEDADAAPDTATLRHIAAGGEYAGVTAEVGVTVTDHDLVGVTLTPASLVVDEGNIGDGYSVALDTQPTAAVTVTITSDNPEVRPNPAIVIFTAADWNPRMVAVIAGEDADNVHDDATLTHRVSGGDYDAITETLPVRVTDNEAAPDMLSLGLHDGINLNLLSPVTVDGKRYYYLDQNGDGVADSGDRVTHEALDALLNSGFDTVAGNPDNHSVIIGEYVVELISRMDLQAFRDEGHSAAPAGWYADTVSSEDNSPYWLADGLGTNSHDRFIFRDINTSLFASDVGRHWVGFEVRLLTPTVNVAPTVGTPIPPQRAVALMPFIYTVPVDAFLDTDPLTYSVAKVPPADWLIFNPTTRTFSGIPTANNVGDQIDITVTAADTGGMVNQQFRITVVPAVPELEEIPDPPSVNPHTPTSVQLPEAIGGILPYRYTLTTTGLTTTGQDDTLPPGMEFLDSTRQFRGAPSQTGTYEMRYTVTDSATPTANATIRTFTFTVNPAPGVTLMPDSLTVTEGIGGTYTAALTTRPTATVTVTIDSDNADVTVTPTPLTFTPDNWAEAQTVAVAAAQDADDLQDDATLTHTFAGGDYGSVEAATLLVTVLDKDAARLTLTNVTVGEADVTVTVTVRVDLAVPGGFTVDVLTEDKSGVGIATANQDYTAISGQALSFAGTAGETQTVTVAIREDDIAETTETVTLSLRNLRDTTAAVDFSATGMVTITDNDSAALALLSMADVSVSETVGEAIVSVQLDSPVEGGFTLVATTTDGSAIAGLDYSDISGQVVTFAGTEDEIQTVRVPIIDDDIAEVDETLMLSLSILPDGDAMVSPPATATITIIDNDLVTISAATIDDIVYQVYAAITPLTLPEAVGGFRPLTYALSGDIPAGLRFDAGSRILTGTPTTTTPATLTYRVTSANGITDQRSFSLSFTSNPVPFVTQWVVGANQSITIPTTGSGYSYSVAWGDGAVTTSVTGNASHTYAEAGTYSVVINGDFPRMYFNNGGNRNAIRAIEQWGSGAWSSMERAFYGCANLTIAATAGNPNLSAVTSLRQMFHGATAMSSPTLSSWEVGHVTDMHAMFFSASAFNQPLSGWNVSNVTTMFRMFSDARSFNRSISSWQVGNVTNMGFMFSGATSYTGYVGGWDVSKVTTMQSMFAGATNYDEVMLGWPVSKVTNMQSMFAGATKFDRNLSAWDVRAVTTMENMFDGVTLSTSNYDLLLLGWGRIGTGQGALRQNVNFDAGDSQFCNLTARQVLTGPTNNWVITDGGVDPGCEEPFITTWSVSGDREIIITAVDDDSSLVYNYFVHWGDDSIDHTQYTGNASHIYAAAGTYTISIFGEFPRIRFTKPLGTTPSGTDKPSLPTITIASSPSNPGETPRGPAWNMRLPTVATSPLKMGRACRTSPTCPAWKECFGTPPT